MGNNVSYKDQLWEKSQEFNGERYIVLSDADNVIDAIYREIDDLEVEHLGRLIDRLKQKLD